MSITYESILLLFQLLILYIFIKLIIKFLPVMVQTTIKFKHSASETYEQYIYFYCPNGVYKNIQLVFGNVFFLEYPISLDIQDSKLKEFLYHTFSNLVFDVIINLNGTLLIISYKDDLNINVQKLLIKIE